LKKLEEELTNSNRSALNSSTSDNTGTETPPNGVDDLYVAVVVRNITSHAKNLMYHALPIQDERFTEAGQTMLSPRPGSVIPDIGAGILVIDPNDIQNVLDNDSFFFLMCIVLQTPALFSEFPRFLIYVQ